MLPNIATVSKYCAAGTVHLPFLALMYEAICSGTKYSSLKPSVLFLLFWKRICDSLDSLVCDCEPLLFDFLPNRSIQWIHLIIYGLLVQGIDRCSWCGLNWFPGPWAYIVIITGFHWINFNCTQSKHLSTHRQRKAKELSLDFGRKRTNSRDNLNRHTWNTLF